MKTLGLIVKYFTFIGAYTHGFFEHLACRMCGVLIEDARYLRANEMCGFTDHELIRKRSASFCVCFFPFCMNLLFGLIFTAAGAVNLYYLGSFFTKGGFPHIVNFLLLWLGLSFLTNLFPSFEDALMLKEHLYGKDKNTAIKVLAAPVFGILYGGAYLLQYGGTLLTSIAFSVSLPPILGTFVPAVIRHFTEAA